MIDEGDGPPVLLLHGFPDSAALWRHQIPALTTAGYRVIAPDLRGFGGSDQPADPAAYAMPTLVADVLGILEARGVERAAVVGHDWGAALGWALATAAPQVVDAAGRALGRASGRLLHRSGPPAGAVLVHAVLPVPRGGRGGAAA